jgi:hypothetical protein
MPEPEKLARQFHDTYERLAPQFGYETRADTKAFDPTSPNGRLMTAVCAEVSAIWAGMLEEAVLAERKRLLDLYRGMERGGWITLVESAIRGKSEGE